MHSRPFIDRLNIITPRPSALTPRDPMFRATGEANPKGAASDPGAAATDPKGAGSDPKAAGPKEKPPVKSDAEKIGELMAAGMPM